MTSDEQAFYASQSTMSDPGESASLLDALPRDPPGVVGVVSGLILHPVFIKRRRVTHPHEGARDPESRAARELLRRVIERDDRPLFAARPYERRIIGTCRDYALLAASILRHHHVPCRLRVGFATYFVRGFHEDHWVCEYRDGQTWRLLDAELDAEALREYPIDFTPWDVPRDRFLTAGTAWQGVRRGTIGGDTCGVSFIGIAGTWFVAASVVRDLATLNKQELLPWDYWGLMRAFGPGRSVPDPVAERLDRLAALIAVDEWREIRAMYEADDLRVPGKVLSFPDGRPVEVEV
ncbi:MAG: transglutaminase domain-containing protein [Candidatus Rokubacteria bacterium]|nr:transglutaminase domain-containing protein [Candidatus Rokubacteria bacterium]